MSFFNLGAVPFMIFLSMFALSMWTISIIINGMMLELGQWAFFILLIPNVLVSLVVTKVLTTPFKGIYKQMNQQGTSKRDLVGKIVEITMSIRPGKSGRAEIMYDDAHLTIDVHAEEGVTISQGQKAIIIQYDKKTEDFIVAPFDV